jgi:hypothetical protein
VPGADEGRQVLVVGESKGYLEKGVVYNFLPLRDNRIKFEINLKAAIQALRTQRGDIVTVTEPDTTVRVWIDEQNSQE